MRHSPGPWILSTDKTVICGAPIDGRSYGVVAKTTEYIDPRDSREANARLIAAAPELLAACEVALDVLSRGLRQRDELDARRVIHAAVEKARGTGGEHAN